jgi:hypothetical protein
LKRGEPNLLYLKISDRETIAIGNVYSARNFRDRAITWRLFLEQNLEAIHFILGGDFNNLEHA